jgi:hypothetical protein
MPAGVQVTVRGGNAAHALAKRLKALNDKDLQKELSRGVAKAMRPAAKEVKASVPEYMPSGYAPTLTKALSLRTSNLASGLRITGTAKGNPRPRKVGDLNKGRLRHPLWGNRERWYTQTVRPRFFDEPLERQGTAVRTELDKVLAGVAAKIRG